MVTEYELNGNFHTDYEESFSQVMSEYADFAYNVAFRILKHPQDAEDAAQDAFLSAYKALPSFQGRSKISTWLYRIVVNASLIKLRKNASNAVSSSYDIEDETAFMKTDGINGTESSVLDNELREEIIQAIACLSPDQRTALLLTDIYQLSGQEAADILDIGLPTFKSRLHRGRLSLRDNLSDIWKKADLEDILTSDTADKEIHQ